MSSRSFTFCFLHGEIEEADSWFVSFFFGQHFRFEILLQGVFLFGVFHPRLAAGGGGNIPAEPMPPPKAAQSPGGTILRAFAAASVVAIGDDQCAPGPAIWLATKGMGTFAVFIGAEEKIVQLDIELMLARGVSLIRE